MMSIHLASVVARDQLSSLITMELMVKPWTHSLEIKIKVMYQDTHQADQVKNTQSRIIIEGKLRNTIVEAKFLKMNGLVSIEWKMMEEEARIFSS